ncbi:CmlA/FloR family chloramphenicol efflux MFS transporter [Aminobacter aganoensis]|uniref:Bcr/CflA family efflux transporter n=1 Tax=Aminobacter aganoensis TaxID=83264 RepID=A0A7X0KLS2_9HYPH|nr:CmlA/FloR family chloramphenicol efflux MFS transporter [Aminobacter aganoensis]MBB6355381.1 DHA1 family florfenicol/chloramphenicol resistance protein-like MFS transporter [Aminobacter aganoensis]
MPNRNFSTWGHSLPAALLLMAPFDILASLAMDIYLPVVPQMPAILGTTPGIVQLTLSLYMIVLGLGQVFFGPVSDRIGRRPVLLGGAVLFAMASFLLAVTSSAAVFLVLRVIQALGASAALVATFATVRDVYAERAEGTVIYGLFSSMLACVPALGPIAGALVAESLGWRAIFTALGILALAAALNALPRWHETRPKGATQPRPAFRQILKSPAFWVYTLGFSAAMGAFFVFFSTAPRVLIDKAGYSQLGFSLAFATAALAMIVTTRFAKWFVARWGIAGCLARGMAMLIFGAALLALGQLFAEPSFWTFVVPMWAISVGIVFAGAVTANGALEAFGDAAGAAVALYFCVQSLIVGIVGTLVIVMLGGDTAWPLAAYCAVMALATLGGLRLLGKR